MPAEVITTAGDQQMRRFEGVHVVVTGAGNGLGQEYALRFAAEGGSVSILDVDEAGANATAEAVRATGGRAFAAPTDVTDEEAVAATIERAVGELGDIGVLVNNAGLHMGRFNETSTLPLAEWRRILDVNVLGALVLAAACRSSMARRGGGAILNISSSAAYVAGGGAYGVSKLALNGLTMSLAAEFAADQIRVVGLAPGMIGSQAVLDRLEQHHKDLVLGTQLLQRFGTPDDVAGVVLFLCSPEAGFLTGQTLLVDGGFHPRS
jgi:NAD(P)-dependent dehydrogenase (short-subunit alcohol dehydrogenase family)